MRAARVTVILLVSALALAAGASRPTGVRAAANRVEVRQFEMAYYPGRSGVRVRLTLLTGEALEFRVDDPVEMDTIQRLGAMFVGGGTRMLVDVDGKSVLSVQIAGPVGFGTGR